MSKGKKEPMPELTNGIRDVVTKLSKSRSESASLVSRARIILLASDGEQNTEISKKVQIHAINVGKWRQRFIDAYPVLREIEETAPEKLEGAVKGCLSDLQRSGHPMNFTQEQITEIIKLACTDPADAGYEMSHWSLSALVNESKKQGIVETISEKTIGRFFNQADLKPHKVRYWLHSSEKYDSPETYAEKVNEICDLYQCARELEDSGTHVVSTDEMTGVQALEHKYPDKLPIPGQCAKQEVEYIRHGTTSLIGFFHIAKGSLYDPYLNQTRTEHVSGSCPCGGYRSDSELDLYL